MAKSSAPGKSRTKFFKNTDPAKVALIELVRHLLEVEKLSVSEAARRASVLPQTIYTYIRRYRIPVILQSKNTYTEAHFAHIRQAIAAGKTYREAGEAIGLDKYKVKNICSRLGILSQTEDAVALRAALAREVPYFEHERYVNEVAVMGKFEAPDDAEAPLVATPAAEQAFSSALAGASFSDVPLKRKVVAKHSGAVLFEHSSLIGCATGDLI